MSGVKKDDGRRSPSKRLVKTLIVLGVLGVAGFLFVRTVRNMLSQPYVVGADGLRGWTLVFDDGAGPTAPYLVLRGPADVPAELSHQIFKRAMESLSTPASAVVPLLLRGEFERSFSGHVTPEQLLAAARNVGLGGRPLVPRCLAYRRASEVGSTRQLFYLLFDMPAFAQFRRALAPLAVGTGAVAFDPTALSPAMVAATSQSTAEQWLPIAADEATDCKAPVSVAAASAL